MSSIVNNDILSPISSKRTRKEKLQVCMDFNSCGDYRCFRSFLLQPATGIFNKFGNEFYHRTGASS